MQYSWKKGGQGAATGALSGAAAGSAVPGIGTAVGAIVGGLAGLLGGVEEDDPEAIEEESRWQFQAPGTQASTDWRKDEVRPQTDTLGQTDPGQALAALEELRKRQRQPYVDPRGGMRA